MVACVFFGIAIFNDNHWRKTALLHSKTRAMYPTIFQNDIVLIERDGTYYIRRVAAVEVLPLLLSLPLPLPQRMSSSILLTVYIFRSRVTRLRIPNRVKRMN